MPASTKYLFIASMDVDPQAEDIFNEVYDTEHIPFLLAVPGVRAITRIKGEAFDFAIAGTVIIQQAEVDVSSLEDRQRFRSATGGQLLMASVFQKALIRLQNFGLIVYY
jgi:hypothetical protein